MSWLRPKGTVSNLEFPIVTMCAFSCLQLMVFLNSGLELREVSSASFELRHSFLSLKEFDLRFGDPFSGVESRVVSLRKLISELHSSKWKLFLKTNINYLRWQWIVFKSNFHFNLTRQTQFSHLRELILFWCLGVSTSVEEEHSDVSEPFLRNIFLFLMLLISTILETVGLEDLLAEAEILSVSHLPMLGGDIVSVKVASSLAPLLIHFSFVEVSWDEVTLIFSLSHFFTSARGTLQSFMFCQQKMTENIYKVTWDNSGINLCDKI